MSNTVYDDQDTETEIARLENAFSAPSADTSGSDIARERQNQGDSSNTPPRVDAADSLDDQESTANDTVGKGFSGKGGSKSKSDKPSLGRRILGSKRTIAIFGTGAFITGAIGFMGFITAPMLQIVHYANILQNPIKISENTSNQRLGRFLGAQRSIGKGGAGENVVARTRVNAVEFKMVRTVNARMAKIGMAYSFNDFGRVNGITIDISKHPDYKSLSDKAAIEKLAKELKISSDQIDAPKRGGTLMKVDVSKLSLKVQRNFFTGQVKTLGEGKIMTALNARHISKYLGLPRGAMLHPWEKAKAKASQTAGNVIMNSDKYKQYKAWEEKRLKAKAAMSDAAKAKLETIRGKLNSKTALAGGAALGAQTAVCLVRDAAEQIPETNRAAVVAPAVVSAADGIAMGSQVQAADDFDHTIISATQAVWVDKDGRTPFDGEGINNLQGKTGGVPIDEGLLKAFSPDNTAASLVKLLDDAVQAETLCSKEAQFIGAIAGITLVALGPGGWAAKAAMGVAGAAAGAAATTIVLKSVNYLFAEKPLETIAHQGPVGGNIDALGAIEMGNMISRTSGGIRLSDSQTALLQQEVFNNSGHQFQKQSLVTRVFNARDYRSLTGKIVDAAPVSPDRTIAMTTKALAEAPGLAFANFASLFGGKKVKAAPVKAMIPYYGVPAGTLESPLVSDPYELGGRVGALLDGPKSGDLIEHASKCWGNNVTQIDGVWDAIKEKDVNPASAEYQEAKCDDWSDDIIALSTWIGDVHDSDAYMCAYASIEEASESCKRAGVEGGSASTATEQAPSELNQDELFQDSSNIACAPNTRTVGVQDGYTGGKLVKINVCAIPTIKSTGEESNGGFGVKGGNGELLVNARISANAYAMGLAAQKPKAEGGIGTTLMASSGFRTMAHQQSLCPCDGENVATPGYSNHQMGLAIDFSLPGKGLSTLCVQRTRAPGNAMWDWLNKYATPGYGFRQYAKEAWHWDVMDDKGRTRCASDG